MYEMESHHSCGIPTESRLLLILTKEYFGNENWKEFAFSVYVVILI